MQWHRLLFPAGKRTLTAWIGLTKKKKKQGERHHFARRVMLTLQRSSINNVISHPTITTSGTANHCKEREILSYLHIYIYKPTKKSIFSLFFFSFFFHFILFYFILFFKFLLLLNLKNKIQNTKYKIKAQIFGSRFF